MTYAAPVFARVDPNAFYQLQIIQNNFCKRASGAPWYAQRLPYYNLKRSSNWYAPRASGTPIGDSARAKSPRDFLRRDAHLVASIKQSRADGIPC
ncbi:hypothetical protein EVAR_61034_1 [Eumeta japonica]|uniref:Uncharacterized protein n=1 Tax=Eumeta variegata TaxID=151549 RepID=A0A4C1ZIX1_EUMVA|nr:hypothetical protein EVAR_61034_1 [Eumeta japonica]